MESLIMALGEHFAHEEHKIKDFIKMCDFVNSIDLKDSITEIRKYGYSGFTISGEDQFFGFGFGISKEDKFFEVRCRGICEGTYSKIPVKSKIKHSTIIKYMKKCFIEKCMTRFYLKVRKSNNPSFELMKYKNSTSYVELKELLIQYLEVAHLLN